MYRCLCQGWGHRTPGCHRPTGYVYSHVLGIGHGIGLGLGNGFCLDLVIGTCLGIGIGLIICICFGIIGLGIRVRV